MVNTGCDLKASPKDDLGGVGSHNLRLTVAYTPTGEKAYSNVQISLVPDLTANLKVTINLNTNAQYTEDKTVTVSVTVVNTGVINATNIGIKISDGNRPIDSKKVPLIPVGASRPTEVNLTWTPSAGAHTICTSYVPTSVPGQGRSCAQVYVQKKPFDYTIFAIILIVIIVMALVGYFGIKYAQGAHDRRAKKEKAEMEAKLKAQMQADFADIYGAAGPPAVGTDPYATGQQPYSGYDQYSGGTAYGDTSPAYQTFKCPRCGQPTAELGVQCFACDAKDSVKYAEEAIKEVKELGIDVDEAETLLNNAKNSLKAGNYEVALEESEEAEDIASEVKERYDKAFSMISAEGAETAAERRRKRLERRKAAREKKDHMDSISGEGAEAAPAPPEGGEGAPPADKQ